MKYGIRFYPEDIVYWCQYEQNGRCEIKWGMVSDEFSDAICIDFLSFRERRRVNGVPIDEFKSELSYRKLPKGWSYDTELFEMTLDELPETALKIDIRYPEQIISAYRAGILVKDETLFQGNVEAEITKKGYRLVKKHSMFNSHPTNTSVKPNRIYRTFEQAQAEKDAYIAELKRQANLSEKEWALERINSVIESWRLLNCATMEEANRYHNWFAGMDRVEDIETRLSMGQIVWRYCDKKKWNFIEL